MRAFVVSVRTDEAELAADVLWSLGVLAVEERTVGEGMVELWTSLGDADPGGVGLPVDWSWRIEEVDDAVVDTWRQYATPIVIDDDLLVVPAWIRSTTSADVTQVLVEPGSTFGLGDHPTTILSLRALRRHLDRSTELLDVGCGSGVLAVTACVLGARSAIAIDISPAAVPVTVDNAARNGVADRVAVSTTPLADIDRSFDLVVANILAPTLVALSADLRRVVAPGGRLIVSGILADRHRHVIDAMAPFEVESTDVLDGWAAVTLHRSS